MPNPQNLKPFVKNDPRIRPKKKGSVSISTEMRRLLESTMMATDVDGVKKLIPVRKLLALAAAKKALAGDSRCIEIMLERTEGKVKQELEHSGNASGIKLILSDNTKVDLNGDSA
jgi:hypothetical protein